MTNSHPLHGTDRASTLSRLLQFTVAGVPWTAGLQRWAAKARKHVLDQLRRSVGAEVRAQHGRITISLGRRPDRGVGATSVGGPTHRAAADTTDVRGLPDRLLRDHGQELRSDAEARACQRLGLVFLPVQSYSPSGKAACERRWNMCRDLFPISAPTDWRSAPPGHE